MTFDAIKANDQVEIKTPDIVSGVVWVVALRPIHGANEHVAYWMTESGGLLITRENFVRILP